MGFPINPPNTPLVDANGMAQREWYKFFLAIQKMIGSSVSDPFDDSNLLGQQSAPVVREVDGSLAPPPMPFAVGDYLPAGSPLAAMALGQFAAYLTQAQSDVRYPRALFDHTGTVGNGTTVETDLYSDTTAAGQLASDGDKFEAEYGGAFVSSGTATRQIKAYFAGTAFFDTGALSLSLSSAWTLYLTLIRVSSTVVRYMASLTTQGASSSAYTAVGELTGLTLSNSNILKITGTAAGVGAASNDITAKLGSVLYVPAA